MPVALFGGSLTGTCGEEDQGPECGEGEQDPEQWAVQ
jgi:hypothetical protein